MELEVLIQYISLNANIWQNNDETNCYAFALGLDIPQEEICRCAYEIGTMYYFYNKTKRRYMHHEELLQLDFKTLKLGYREADIYEPLKEGEWKIAYFDSIYECGFHFFRQTENGVWWHKFDFGYTPTCLDDDNNIITNPTNCHINHRGLEYQKCYILKKNQENSLF